MALFTHRSTPNQSPDPKLSIVSRKHNDIEPNDIVPLDAMYTCHQNIRGDQIYYVIMLVESIAWLHGWATLYICARLGVSYPLIRPRLFCVCVCESIAIFVTTVLLYICGFLNHRMFPALISTLDAPPLSEIPIRSAVQQLSCEPTCKNRNELCGGRVLCVNI